MDAQKGDLIYNTVFIFELITIDLFFKRFFSSEKIDRFKMLNSIKFYCLIKY